MIRALAVVLAWLALPATAFAAPPGPAAQTDALLATLTQPDAPGLVVGVCRDGRVAYRGARGLGDLEQRIPLDAASVFHIASVSKQFTGFAALQLAAERKLDLGADIHRYLPDLPDFGATVRVSHLLNMTSGIKDQWALLRLSGRDWQDVLAEPMLREAIVRNPQLDFAPGSDYAYSNSNYLLLAEIIAKVAGEPFEKHMQRAVFGPQGMDATFVYADVNSPVPHRANSYYYLKDRGWRRQLLAYENWGATSVHSTLDDLLRWGIALRANRLQGKPLYLALAQPSTLGNGRPNLYGAGLYRSQSLGRTSYEHSGADASFRTLIRYFPDADIGFVVLTNAELDVDAIATRLARIWLPGAPDEVVPRDRATPPTDASGDYAGGRTDGVLRLLIDQGRLTARTADSPYQPLYAVAADRVESADGALQLMFKRDGKGLITALEAVDAGNPAVPVTTKLRRLPSPGRVSPGEYIGAYRSDALDTTLRVFADGDVLKIAPRLSPLSFAMDPVAPDRFEMWDYAFRTATFEREKGRVTALLIRSARALDVRFERVEKEAK